ncbi:MAG: ABC transporter permease [Clostridia bacterium]|nr:ABC transporter permease [Clostridia bacterium]
MKKNFFKRLYEYRELLKTNVKKDVRGKYKKSFFGFLWSFLNPLLQITVYAIVFPLILKNTQENYVIFLCTGLIPWTFFSITISRAAGCMIENGNILKKVYFPREIIPISLVTAEAFNFIISTIIILGFVIFGGLGITKYVIFYPIILIVQYLLVLALSFIISAVTVYFRDLQHFISVGLQLLFYGTPIVYSGETIPEAFKWIININPMSYIISAFRDIFYNQQMPDLISLGKLAIILIFACIVGYLIFNKLQKRFAEEL